METIKIVKSNRKTFSLEVKRDGSVILRAPIFASNRQIEEFYNKNKAWLEKHIIENKKRTEKSRFYPAFTEDEIKALKVRAKQYIPKRVEYWAEIIGVKYNSVSIRAQKTRWGSCSSKGNLNFNCLLMLTDTEAIDYVVIHALCHIKELNHSKRFWSLVETYMPNYKEVQKRIKSMELQIFSRLEK